MSLYLMWVYSIARSQLCFNWVLDYVSMRLLSPTQFIWRPSVPQFSSSGTHRINTSSNVTVLMSVYSITRSQLCWDWVLDYVSMRLLSLTQFIWRPSVLQLCCSGTHRINTRSNVTVPDVSVFHRKKSIVFQLGAWLCNHETALPHTIHLETIRPQFSSSGTHRINTSSNVTVPDVSVFHRKKSIVFQLGAWLCKHETALPTQFIWRPSVPQFSSSGTHRINTSSNVTVPDVSVFHHKESIVVSIGCLIM